MYLVACCPRSAEFDKPLRETIMEPRTYSLLVKGDAVATYVVLQLVTGSQWFEFEPLPDAVYMVTVKAENVERVRRWMVESLPV